MTSRFTPPFYDVGSGITPASGAQLFFFEIDGATPKDTHTTKAATIANANPVIANSVGVFPDIYITGDYKITLKDKNGSQIFGLADINEFATISDSAFVKNFDTLALAIADKGLSAENGGDRFTVGDRGGATFKVVLKSTVTVNVFTPVASTGNVLNALQLVPNGNIWSNQVGIPTDGTDAKAGHDVAVNLAVSEALGVVRFTPGEYTYLTAPANHTRAISLIGPTPPSTAVNAAAAKQTAFLVHAYSGDFLTFNGSAGLGITGSGGKVENFSILNKFGAPGSGNGRAIVIDGIDSTERSTWLRLLDLEINSYSSSFGEFTWAIDIDGSTVTAANGGVRDVFINRVRIAAAAGADGGCRITTAFNIFLNDLFLNLPQGNLLITGASSAEKSTSIFGSNVSGQNITVDFADNVNFTGGRMASVTYTANTSNNVHTDFTSLNTIPTAPNAGSYKSFIDANTRYNTRSGNANVEIFGRDENAGDSTNSVNINVGNLGADQGSMHVQYTNTDDIATGQQFGFMILKGRNVADTGVANFATIKMTQVGTTDAAQIDFLSGNTLKMRIFQEGNDGGDFLGSWRPIGASLFDLGSSGNPWRDAFVDTVKVSNIQVVGAQGAVVADATDAASVILRLNDLLARLRTHGLIDT